MKIKKTLITITGTLGVFGAVSLLLGPAASTIYHIVSSFLLILVAVGGLTEYNSQHMRDFREIYREKYLMRKEQEERLQEEIVNLKAQITRIGEIKHPAEEKAAYRGRCNGAACGVKQ
jgi:hypothetical protein